MTDTINVEGIQLPVSEPEPVTDTAPNTPGEAPPEQAQPAPVLETAFVVYINPQGHWVVTPDVHAAATMQIMRPANTDDIFMGCSMVVKDVQVQETAGMAARIHAQVMEQMAQQVRRQEVNEQIQQIVGAPAGAIDLSSLKR